LQAPLIQFFVRLQTSFPGAVPRSLSFEFWNMAGASTSFASATH
jgi:hypothetical protein